MKRQHEAICNVRALLDDLKSCSVRRELPWGRRIHAKALQGRNESNIYVVTGLVKMYAKCGSMTDARHTFDNAPKPDVVSWNALLLGYADNGEGLVALDLFARMKTGGFCPDSVTYVAAFKACTSLALTGACKQCLERGREIHLEVGHRLDKYVHSALVDMYAKCGSMADARGVFDAMQDPDAVSWNALIQGYAENGEGHVALELFSRMKCAPTFITYIAALKACSSLVGNENKRDCLERGREIHSKIGCHLNIYVQNTLIDMYAKCGSMVDALRVFSSLPNPNVVSWNALITGYAENGEGVRALDMFTKMKACGCQPNSITFVAALKACSCLPMNGDGKKRDSLERGRQIHSEIDCHLNQYVKNALIDMYGKCGSMDDARRAFDSIEKPDVVSWTALLLGYAENGDGNATLDLFSEMKASGCLPNSITYITVLKACGSLGCLERGREIHMEIGSDLDQYVESTLIDMYAKCGSMNDARRVFTSIKSPDTVSWNALLMGYAENGQGLVALSMFSRMKSAGCQPNSVTYVAALKACTSLAVNGAKSECLERGREIHSEIGSYLDDHVQSMLIDMYSKCGCMDEAQQALESMQNPDVVSWTTLLLGYAENGDGHAVLELFSRMKSRGRAPDCVTYIAAVKACTLIGDLALGRKLHLEIREFSAHLVTCLVGFYAKCGSMLEAREVFDSHPRHRSVCTWNALLAGYATFGDTEAAFNLFEAMQEATFRPDDVTFVCMLLCCSHGGLVGKATEYFKVMQEHYGVPPNVMHYTCMVDVLGRGNQLNEAVAMVRRMPIVPDAVTWMSLLGASRQWKNSKVGRWAFQSLVDMDKKQSPSHVLMAHVCGREGLTDEALDEKAFA